MTKLCIRNLTKKFAGQTILDKVSLSVEDGEFVSILGPSGSGKSTLFHLIGGITNPDSGDIWLDGRRMNGERGGISYTPQAPSLLPWRTILQNVMLGAELTGDQDERKALELINRAGLKGYEKAYPHELSGGMMQRAAFVRSLLSPQQLICLDEPFSALDEFTRLDMQAWLLSIWQSYQRSILFITHNIEEAIYLSDRVIVLSQKPTTIKQELQIPFERPRNKNLTLSEEFLEWKKMIYHQLQNNH
ncbi:ABC transporter ATP-binding protein [Virgibacillus ihumii]|uniref:ABC transporter ATP-binding protein n=1 Tax=Virgibacillus ihumii TaxID=2686091 RepID=UPI00157D3BED|nr:ABC transporter ATP-binding protein [Virgibacillus ihumii]